MDNVVPIREKSLPGETLTLYVRGRELDLVRVFAKRLGTIETNVVWAALALGLAEMRKRLNDRDQDSDSARQFEENLRSILQQYGEPGKPKEPTK